MLDRVEDLFFLDLCVISNTIELRSGGTSREHLNYCIKLLSFDDSA